MQYVVSIDRVSVYRVEANSEDEAIDLALEGGTDVDEIGGETTHARAELES